MLEKRTKLSVLIFLILVTLSILTPDQNQTIGLLKTPSRMGQAPIRKVDITLVRKTDVISDQNQNDQLFEQLRKFAAKHTFTINIRQSDPSGVHFAIDIWREDIEIHGYNNDDSVLFEFGFYNTDMEYPIPEKVFDELIFDLKSWVEEIPNTTFSVFR